MSADLAAQASARLVRSTRSAPPRRIGPNALTRVAEALTERVGPARADAVFRAAGLAHRFAAPPTAPVPVAEAAALTRALFQAVGPAEAHLTTRRAGALLGAYLLAVRIPRGAQAVIKASPRRLGATLLFAAMARNAATFAGDGGKFSVARAADGWRIRLDGSALAGAESGSALWSERPVCGLFSGAFEALLRALVDDGVRVRETCCAAQRPGPCLFEARLGDRVR